MLRLTETQYRAEITRPQITLLDSVIEALSEELEITTEAIRSGALDYRTLAQRQAGNATCLPEKYAVGAHSKVRTSSHILDYIEIHHGWRARNQILRHFQLNESIFANPETKISIRFLAELWTYLHSKGVTIKEFHQIGKYSVISNINNPVGQHFRKLPNPKAAYESLITEIVHLHYDKNFTYSLKKLEKTNCVIEAKPNPMVLDELKNSFIGNIGTCASRGGTISSLLGYLDLPDANVIETTCVHRGDPQCRYFVLYENQSSAKASRAAN